MTMTFKRAERTQQKIKIGLQGPAGSGKTRGALALARELVPNGKVALIDTENGSASLYSDEYVFDTVELSPPFLSEKYEQAIDMAVELGYDVLVIDSLTHQWAGEGGILARKDQTDKKGGNSYTNWGAFTKEHNRFVSKVLHAPIHIIATLRSKADYVLEAKEGGKAVPKKVGMAAIQREGFDYEFSLLFDIGLDHEAIATKDRTRLFSDGVSRNLLKPDIGRAIRNWLATGKPLEDPAKPIPASPEQVAALEAAALDDRLPMDVREKVGAALAGGLSEKTAAKWITQIESKLQPA